MGKSRLRAVKKPKNGQLGVLFFSYFNPKHDGISRMLVPLTRWGRKGQEIQVITKSTGSQNWLYKLKKQGKRKILRKIAMSKRKPLEEIMKKLNTEFIKKQGFLLIGAQIELDRERETWVSAWAKIFSEKNNAIKRVARVLQDLKNDGTASASKIRFYENLRKLYAADLKIETGVECRATCRLLESEINNFSKPFDIRI